MRYTFYPNSKDDFHCGQAVLSMMLSAYGMHLEFRELDFLLKQKGAEGVWDVQFLNVMSSLGFEGHSYSDWSIRRFARLGVPYAKRYFSRARFQAEDRYTDWEVLQSESKRVIKDPHIKTFIRRATYADIRKYIKHGWMVMPFVNSHALKGKEGFSGHAVLVTKITPTHITIHDPGLPPHPNWRLTKAQFLKGFNRNIKAFRRKKHRA